MDDEELIASGFSAGWTHGEPRVEDISSGQCRECREIIQIPRGFFADWDDASSGRIPEHDCAAKQHYSDPGPKPYGLGPCICAEEFAEGEASHLQNCPQEPWRCSCGFVSWGPTCRDCGKPRNTGAPEGW